MVYIAHILPLIPFASCIVARHVPRASIAPTVAVKNGTYIGFNDPILNTDNFYGVAYAQPPLENLRFGPPQPLNSSWSGERIAVDYPKQCITTGGGSAIENVTHMSEDCLHMDNIAAFGGDPSRVTIQGQSTGAQSVGLQLLAYGGDHGNLFTGAISESGAPVWFAPTASVSLWQPTCDGFVNAAGCGNATDNLDCLRGIDNATLSEIFNNKTLNPFESNAPREYMFVVDGDFIPEPNSVLLQSGKFARVPYLIGTNFVEGTTVGPKGVNNTANLNTYLVKEMLTIDNTSLSIADYLYPDIPSSGVPASYRGRPPATAALGSQYKRACTVGSDVIMDAPTRLTTLSLASFNSTVYRYHFNVQPNGYTDAQGSTHASEVPLTFYDIPGVGYTVSPLSGPNSDKLIGLADIMTTMWISFVYYGDPNSIISTLEPSVPIWPQYELPDPQNFVFTINASLYTEPDTSRAAGINWMMDMMIASKN